MVPKDAILQQGYPKAIGTNPMANMPHMDGSGSGIAITESFSVSMTMLNSAQILLPNNPIIFDKGSFFFLDGYPFRMAAVSFKSERLEQYIKSDPGRGLGRPC